MPPPILGAFASPTPDQLAAHLRQLVPYLTQLEQRLNATLPVGARQQGPIPGWLTAGQIGPGAGLKSSMHLNLDGNQPGVAPRASVTDPNGIVRWEDGNLAANGSSPAQYGGRANDATGAPIWDSIGVLGIPKKLAEVINTSAVQGTNTSFADVSGAVTPTFTLSRQANLLTMAMGRIACQPANSNDFALLGLRCGPNTTSGAPGEVDAATATVMFVPYGLFFWTTLAAGSYTAALQANAQGGAGAQWNVAYADVAVFLFGG